MAIAFKKYVNITSGVAGANQAPVRNFKGRIFTPNILTPSGGVLTFDTAADVADYYGSASTEYKRAVKYFGYQAPVTLRQPQQIDFALWPQATVNSAVYGDPAQTATLTALKLITAGTLTFVIGGAQVIVGSITLASASTLAAVATTIQTALNADDNLTLKTATVAYDTVNARFVFTGGLPTVSDPTFTVISTGGSSDLATALGWISSSTKTIIQRAILAQEPVDTFDASVEGNNNFGSFIFDDLSVTPLTIDQITAVAQANKALNVTYQYHVNVQPANTAAWSTALANISGCSLNFQAVHGTNDYIEQLPMEVLASTDFTALNGQQGYMYRQDATAVADVTDTPTSDLYDSQNINYYGNTQVDGQLLSFYQDGVLMGLATDPTDMNTYANEQWLRDYAGSQIINLQLALPGIGANTGGLGTIRAAFVQNVIPAALRNGTIAVGKTLNATQQIAITQITGDSDAWQTVQNKGYILLLSITSAVGNNGKTQYTCVYNLIYAKDDLIRNVVGTHTLI